jgi:hypothetical protein
MANYTSNLMRRQQAQAPLNTEAIGFVLQSKENKWNANQAKIDEKLSQLGSIQLERGEDKEYLVNNVEKLLGSISNAGRLDYSSDSVARGLDMALTSSIDDYIINQVGIAKKISSFKSGVQELAKKDPNSYNSGNYQYALEKAGIDAYMNKETDDIKNLNYTPYTDVNSTVQKGIKDLREYNKETEIEIPINDNGVRRILTKKVKDLNEVELRGYVMSQLGAKEQQQLAINGWSDFKGYDDGQVKDLVTNVFSTKSKSISSKISMLEETLKNSPQDWQKTDIQNRINILNQEKSYIESNLTTSDLSRETLERMYKEEELVNNITASNLDVDVSYSMGKTDSAYYDEQKRQLEILKFKQDEFATKNLSNTGNPTIDSGLNTGQLGTFTVASVPKETLEIETLLQQDYKNANDNLNQVYNTHIKGKFDSNDSWKKFKAENKDNGKNERELFQEWSQNTNNNVTYKVNGEERMFAQDVNEASDIFASINNTYKEVAETKFETNLDAIYEEATSEGVFNRNEFPVVDEEGNSQVMTEYLRGYSKEDFKNNKDGIKDTVKKNLYLNRAFSQMFTGSNLIQKFDRNNPKGELLMDNKTGLRISSGNNLSEARKLMSVIGENIEDYLNFKDTEGNLVNLGEVQEGTPLFAEYKSEQAKKYALNSFNTAAGTDKLVGKEGRLKNIIGFEDDSNATSELLKKQFFTTSSKGLSVRPNMGKGGKELGDIFNVVKDAILTNGTGELVGKIDANTPILIQENPNDKDFVIISQEYEYTMQGQKQATTRTGTILKRDLESKLGFGLSSVSGDSYVNNSPIKPTPISYTDNSVGGLKMEKVLVGMVSRGEVMSEKLLHKKDILTYFKDGYALGTDGEPTEGYNLASNIINKPDKFGVEYLPDGETGFVKIVDNSDPKNPKEITSFEVRDSQNIKRIRNTVRYTPQILMSLTLKQMIEEYKLVGDSSELYNKFKNAGQ